MTFEAWAIVEIMGHNRVAGKVTEQVIAGAAMLRVDVPTVGEIPEFSKFYSAAAIYAITPTTEDIAKRMAAQLCERPVILFDLPTAPALAAKFSEDFGSSYDEMDDLDTPDDDDDGEDYDDDELWDEEDEGAPIKTDIIKITRDVTKNSGSPMWRMVDGSSDKINVFKHDDPAKDTFHLFEAAGYGDMLMGMAVGDTIICEGTPMDVMIRQIDGWWTPVSVPPKKDSFTFEPEKKPQTPSSDRDNAIKWAKHLMHDVSFHDLRYFDVETTGTGPDAEIVQIGVLDYNGEIILDQRVKPTENGLKMLTKKDGQRGLAPVDIHGITPEMLADEPTFDQVIDKVREALGGKTVIIYNADYDVRMLRQVCDLHKLPWVEFEAHCAMLRYAEFAGEWNDYFGNWKWHKLGDACRAMRIEVEGEHDSVKDCNLTRHLVQAMSIVSTGERAKDDIPF